MKLLIVLSVLACGYAAKLDRTYLPPASAGSSGGSPGSLNTPLGPSAFGQPAGFGQPRPSPGFSGVAGSTTGSAFGASGSNQFGSQSSQYSQPGGTAPGQAAGANFDSGFGAPAQNFGNQAQDYQRSQPQRAQASAEQSAEILRSDNQNDGETFSYSFETSNGISAEESGVATNGVQAQGAFAYSSDDGQMFRVQYTADENGYQPQGDHLPTSPPIPEEILKSIEENARAAASGTQEGAYNPNEDNNDVSLQQYNTNAPTSYNQAPTGQNRFNQAGIKPAKLYDAPNAGPGSESFQDFSEGSSQQYNAGSRVPSSGSSRPSNGFGQSQVKSPSQLYGSSSNGASRSSGFGQQGSSNQYSARPAGISNFAPTTSQGQSQQYQTSSFGQFSSTGRPQGSAQVQDASGYQYNKPQGGIAGNINNGPSQQYRPQNGASSGLQGFSRPNENSFPTTGLSNQSPFGASPKSQGPYGSAPNSQGSFPSPGIKGASSFGSNSQTSYGSPAKLNSQNSFGAPSSNGAPGPKSPSPFGSNSQTSYGSPAKLNSQSSFGAPSSNGAPGPKSFSPFGSNSQTSYGSPAKLNSQSSFGAPSPKSPSSFGSNSQVSYGSSSKPNSAFGASAGSQPTSSASSSGFVKPQAPGPNGQTFSRLQGQAPAAKSPMSDSGYEYNRPSGSSPFSGAQSGSAPFGSSQNVFKPQQGGSAQFEAARAPPSFSEEEGYKY